MNSLVLLILIIAGGALLSYFGHKINKILGNITVFAVALIIPIYWFTQVDFTETVSFTVSGFHMELGYNMYGRLFSMIVMILSPLALIYAIGYMKDQKKLATFYFSFLFSILGMTGILMSRDFVSLFIFWEIMTWSSYLLVIFLGKDVQKTGIKYMVFSAIGAYAMLMAIVIIYKNTGSMMLSDYFGSFAGFTLQTKLLTGILLLLGFAVKSAVMPFHVWAPGAYSNTPMAYTSVFSGALSKMGIYGLGFVVVNLFAQANLEIVGYVLAWLGAITAVLATFSAVFQHDAKKLLAYSSIAQLGYIVTGIGIGTELSIMAGLYLAVLHAAFKGVLFMVVGAVERQAGTTDMNVVSGLVRKMPFTFFTALIAIIALAGIPPLGGFVGKWMLYESLINNGNFLMVIMIFLSSTAAFLYCFKFLFGLFLGQQELEFDHVKEASPIMIIPMLLLSVFLLVTGAYPGIVFKYIAEGMTNLGFHNVNWQMSVLTNAWGDSVNVQHVYLSVVVVFVAFLIFITWRGYKHATKISTKDISSSGEMIKPEDNMTYAMDFYKPFERVLSPILKYKINKYYEDFGKGLEALFDFMRRIYTGNGQTYAVYVIVFLAILLIFSKSIFGY
ncbi:MAG: hypothetical protein GXO80_07405 [Chlorobi bacterium]|nr:hypothetical protein [Chlorobiota bacterium]